MNSITLTLHNDGSVSSLYDEKNHSFFSSLGKQNIERCSLIKWHEEYQKWYVEFIKEFSTPIKSKVLNVCYASFLDATVKFKEKDKTLYFKSYNDAKKAEIMVLNELRSKYGIYPI